MTSPVAFIIYSCINFVCIQWATHLREEFIMKVLTALGVLIFVFLLMLSNCTKSCSPAMFSAVLFPIILLVLFIGYRLLSKKS